MKPSTITGAGDGLFAKEFFFKGFCLGNFIGTQSKSREGCGDKGYILGSFIDSDGEEYYIDVSDETKSSKLRYVVTLSLLLLVLHHSLLIN